VGDWFMDDNVFAVVPVSHIGWIRSSGPQLVP
jgi:hypothetical protein